MISLYFDPTKFPRTIGRQEWYEIWRWKRTTTKKLAEVLRDQTNMLITYGATMHPKLKSDLIDHMVNPPLLIHDKMDLQ